MKSAILVESKKPLVVTNVELPSKIEFGQVQIKVCYSGICGAQINEIDAVKGPDKFLPHFLGHEGSGVVEKIVEGELMQIEKNLKNEPLQFFHYG